ncbi:MAG: FtsX-like permease family protein [Vicinamibacteria bacterium]
MAFSVARRTREIGLRVALGARRVEVLALVFGQALKLALFGALFGLAGALLSGRFLSSLLFGVGALDPWSYGAMFLALLILSVLASYFPARRATAVDPMLALRAD